MALAARGFQGFSSSLRDQVFKDGFKEGATCSTGIDVKVPADLEVECIGTAILGGFTFFGVDGGGVIASRRVVHKGVEGSKRRVKIICRTLMGGVEVKAL